MKKTTTKAKVGAMSTHDHKDPKPATKKPATVPDLDPKDPKKEPDGNTPVDKQPEVSERERLRPADQA